MKIIWASKILKGVAHWMWHLLLIWGVLRICGLINWPWYAILTPLYLALALCIIDYMLKKYQKNHPPTAGDLLQAISKEAEKRGRKKNWEVEQ